MKENRSYRIYLADIRPLLDETLQQRVYDRLSRERQEKADRCRFPHARAASLAAGFLMEYALKDQQKQRCHIGYGQSGAPLVLDENGAESGYISLSHSGDFAVCVISDRPVGIDLQKKKTVKIGMLRHFMGQQEQEAFLEQYRKDETEEVLSEEGCDAFLRQWAAKESYMKLTGQGMSMGFDRIRVWQDASGMPVRISDLKQEFPEVGCREHQVQEGYWLNVSIL